MLTRRASWVWLGLLLLWGVDPVAGAAGAQISTAAGTGQAGFDADGGAAVGSRINNPYGVVRGPDGQIYFCDMDNHRVRRVDRDGRIHTVAGTGRRGYSGDGGSALAADLNEPYEIRFDRQGHLFVVEMKNHLVRRIDRETGAITRVAGTGEEGFAGDDGPADRARMRQPHSIQFGPDGRLYICDIGNHRIRVVDLTSGIIRTFAGTGERRATPDKAPVEGTPLNGPRAIDFDARGDLWVALREGNQVYRIDMKSRTFQHEAGTGAKGFSGHGEPAVRATLSGPKGLSIAPNGDVYLADTESHSIRRLDVARGTIEWVAGTGERGDGPDGRDPRRCGLARPHGVFVDADGAVLIGDSENHRIRVVR